MMLSMNAHYRKYTSFGPSSFNNIIANQVIVYNRIIVKNINVFAFSICSLNEYYS